MDERRWRIWYDPADGLDGLVSGPATDGTVAVVPASEYARLHVALEDILGSCLEIFDDNPDATLAAIRRTAREALA